MCRKIPVRPSSGEDRHFPVNVRIHVQCPNVSYTLLTQRNAYVYLWCLLNTRYVEIIFYYGLSVCCTMFSGEMFCNDRLAVRESGSLFSSSKPGFVKKMSKMLNRNDKVLL